jgi:hypothetical protein
MDIIKWVMIISTAISVFIIIRSRLYQKKVEQNGQETEAEILETNIAHSSNGNSTIIIGYTVDRVEYKAVRDFFPGHRIGDKLKIIYQADNPKNYIPESERGKSNLLKNTVVALIALAVIFVMLMIYYFAITREILVFIGLGVVVLTVICTFIVGLKIKKKLKKLMLDERLKNAELFKLAVPFAVSPDGYLGTTDALGVAEAHNKSIFQLNEIKGICISIDNEKIKRDAGLLFENISSEIEPYINGNPVKEISILFTFKDGMTLSLPMLVNNQIRDRTGYTYPKKVPVQTQNKILNLLSALENAERR